MRVLIFPESVRLWLSATDTYKWAHRPGNCWPGSQLSGNRLFAEFDTNGLCDLTINGRSGDCDSSEFSALCADHLALKLPPDHPCYFIAVGQFRQEHK